MKAAGPTRKILHILLLLFITGNIFSQPRSTEDTSLLRKMEEECVKKQNAEHYKCIEEISAIAEKNLARKNLSDTLKKEYLTFLASAFNAQGLYLKKKANVMQALEYYHKSLKICEATNEKSGAAAISNNIGTIYSEMGEREKAIEYFRKAQAIAGQLNNKKGISIALNNIGLEYYYQARYDIALDYYKNSLTIREELKDPRLVAIAKENIGLIYFQQKKYNEAYTNFKESYDLNAAIKYLRGIAFSCYYLSITHNQLGNLDKAVQFGKKALALGKECGHPDAIRNAARALKEVYEKRSDFSNALLMFELFNQMNDSINNDQNRKASIRKQFQFEYEKKIAADSVKHMEEKIVSDALFTAQQAKLQQEKMQFWFLAGGIVFLCAGLIIVINRFRITQKQKKIIETQKEQVDFAYHTLHVKNKEVMDSIHYARRIQSALMPTDLQFERYLKKTSGK